VLLLASLVTISLSVYKRDFSCAMLHIKYSGLIDHRDDVFSI